MDVLALDPGRKIRDDWIVRTLAIPFLLAAASVGATVGLEEPPAVARAGRSGPQPPRIEVRAPEAMAPQVERLARFDVARLAAVMRLVGLDDAGPPIPVYLAPEDAPVARRVPEWVAGFASNGTVVLFPARALAYPHDSLEGLLHHEVAHVLIDRAAGGQQVPRWFHEGVALAAERSWSLGERANFALDVAFGGRVQAAGIDRLFQGGPGQAGRAYRLSALFVRDLLGVHGPDLPARVLAGMRDGLGFDEAFEEGTGASVDEAIDRFWGRRVWVAWLPWLTSPGALWALATLLVLAAFIAVRRRRRRARQVWEEEED